MGLNTTPPKPVYLSDAFSLRSLRRSPTPSLHPEGTRLKATRSFVFLSDSKMKKFNGKDDEFISDPPASIYPLQDKPRPFGSLKSALSNGRSSPSPRASLLHRISNTFKKEPKHTSPPSPSSSPLAKNQRDIALRERGLLPPDPIADRHYQEQEQQERLARFKFGIQRKRSFPGPFLKVTPEPFGPPSVNKAPSALNLLGPSTGYFPQSRSQTHLPPEHAVIQRNASHGSSYDDCEVRSYRRRSHCELSIASDESSTLATPSHPESHQFLYDSINPLKSTAAAVGLTAPAIWEGDLQEKHGLPWEDEDEIDPDRPSPFLYAHSPTIPKAFHVTEPLPPPTAKPVNPTMHTQGSISAAVEAVADDESRRLAEVAYLT